MPKFVRAVGVSSLALCFISCIGSPPGANRDGGPSDAAADAADAPVDDADAVIADMDASEGGDVTLDMRADAPGRDTGSSDVSGDAADVADPTDAADAGRTAEPFAPRPSFEVAWLGSALDVQRPEESPVFRLYLRYGLNAHITFETPDTLDPDAYDLIFSSADGQLFEPALADLADLAVPVVSTSSSAWNDWGMANGTSTPDEVTAIELVDGPDPRTADLPVGSTVVYGSSGVAISRPTLAPGATVWGENSIGEVTYATFDTGDALLEQQSAPARRVMFGLIHPSRYTPAGFRLLGSAVEWALGRDVTTPFTCHLIYSGNAGFDENVLAARMRLHGCAVEWVNLEQGPDIQNTDLIVVHGDVEAPALGMALRDFSAPVLVLTTNLSVVRAIGAADGGATGSLVNTTSWAVRGSQVDARVRASHSGVTPVVTTEAPFESVALSDLPDGAIPIAGDPVMTSSRVLYWVIPAGSAIDGGAPAPARRAVFSVPGASDKVPTDEYQQMLDAAFQWSLYGLP